MAPQSPSVGGEPPDSPLSLAGPQLDAPSAMTRCFFTVELHEQILLKLPMGEILKCMRVSRQWKDLIDHIPSLQRALWMAPPASGPLDVRRSIEKLVHCNVEGDGRVTINQPSPAWTACPYPSVSFKLHPQLINSSGDCPLKLWYYLFRNSPSIFRDKDKDKTELVLDYSFLNCSKVFASKSWSRMYITDPPVTVARFSLAFPRVWVEVHSPGGVTMNEFLLAIEKEAWRLHRSLRKGSMNLKLWAAPEQPDSR
ncbi:hypothetical protein BU16DRAFT_582072 [Lophium mytilinum]|uniref:F-box domain-containing protein n=1 Tax=Lophium mytilinum TaxID=390894 RepID=A0A6A6QWK8_9PEZI|nr:hypothetical protein BU16DRAFT_582072 [Lophium mytilinum]